jgi:hypothetical protein
MKKIPTIKNQEMPLESGYFQPAIRRELEDFNNQMTQNELYLFTHKYLSAF